MIVADAVLDRRVRRIEPDRHVAAADVEADARDAELALIGDHAADRLRVAEMAVGADRAGDRRCRRSCSCASARACLPRARRTPSAGCSWYAGGCGGSSTLRRLPEPHAPAAPRRGTCTRPACRAFADAASGSRPAATASSRARTANVSRLMFHSIVRHQWRIRTASRGIYAVRWRRRPNPTDRWVGCVPGGAEGKERQAARRSPARRR